MINPRDNYDKQKANIMPIVQKIKKAASEENRPKTLAVLVRYVQKVAPQRCPLILAGRKDRNNF